MKQMCYNCKYASEPFELRGHKPSTHHHCQHPSVADDKPGWGTLKEFWYKCEKYEANNNTDKRSE